MQNQKPSIAAFTVFLVVCCLIGAVAGFAWSAWDAQEEPYVERH